MILASDCIVSPEDFDSLINTLFAVTHSKSIVFLSYEKRNFAAEAEFFVKLSKFFRFSLVKEEELDEQWRAPEDIFLFQLFKK